MRTTVVKGLLTLTMWASFRGNAQAALPDTDDFHIHTTVTDPPDDVPGKNNGKIDKDEEEYLRLKLDEALEKAGVDMPFDMEVLALNNSPVSVSHGGRLINFNKKLGTTHQNPTVIFNPELADEMIHTMSDEALEFVLLHEIGHVITGTHHDEEHHVRFEGLSQERLMQEGFSKLEADSIITYGLYIGAQSIMQNKEKSQRAEQMADDFAVTHQGHARGAEEFFTEYANKQEMRIEEILSSRDFRDIFKIRGGEVIIRPSKAQHYLFPEQLLPESVGQVAQKVVTDYYNSASADGIAQDEIRVSREEFMGKVHQEAYLRHERFGAHYPHKKRIENAQQLVEEMNSSQIEAPTSTPEVEAKPGGGQKYR